MLKSLIDEESHKKYLTLKHDKKIILNIEDRTAQYKKEYIHLEGVMVRYPRLYRILRQSGMLPVAALQQRVQKQMADCLLYNYTFRWK